MSAPLKTNTSATVPITTNTTTLLFRGRNSQPTEYRRVRLFTFYVSGATGNIQFAISEPGSTELITLRDEPGGTAITLTGNDSFVCELPSNCDLHVISTAVSGTIRVGVAV